MEGGVPAARSPADGPVRHAAGAEDFVEIRRWAVLTSTFYVASAIRERHPQPRHAERHHERDRRRAVRCLLHAVGGEPRRTAPNPETGPEVVAIDGKTSRRTHDRAQDRNPLHLVSAWASGQRLVLGQQACAAKSNEITAIPLLLDRLAIRGALVTIDAMGCQTRIAQKIVDRQADYLLAVKDNCAQPPRRDRARVRRSPDQEVARPRDHRRRSRPHRAAASRRQPRRRLSPDRPALPRRAPLSRPPGHRHGGNRGRTRRQEPAASAASTSARSPSRPPSSPEPSESIGTSRTRLHWVLDVVFHEDLNRLRSGHGPQNMATVRHISSTSCAEPRTSTARKVRRKSADLGRRLPRSHHPLRPHEVRSSDCPVGRPSFAGGKRSPRTAHRGSPSA